MAIAITAIMQLACFTSAKAQTAWMNRRSAKTAPFATASLHAVSDLPPRLAGLLHKEFLFKESNQPNPTHPDP
jgi:hypothetical protein